MSMLSAYQGLLKASATACVHALCTAKIGQMQDSVKSLGQEATLCISSAGMSKRMPHASCMLPSVHHIMCIPYEAACSSWVSESVSSQSRRFFFQFSQEKKRCHQHAICF